jgi:hypothetical protein
MSVAKETQITKIRFPRRTIFIALGIGLLHVAIAYALDAAGLIESLLSPSGTRLLWILPLAVAFYALRLVVYFVVPGVVAGSLLMWALDRKSAKSR